MIRFVSLTGTWWLYGMVSVRPRACTSKQTTAAPAFHVPLSHRAMVVRGILVSCFDGCSCFAQNLTMNVFGSGFWQMQLKRVRLNRQFYKVVYRGPKSAWMWGLNRKMRPEREGDRERERERKKTNQPRTVFHSLQIFFPAGHQKVLVTPKQLHHCFDNSDTPTHSCRSCWTWTTVHCTLVRFINVSPMKNAFFLCLVDITVSVWLIINWARHQLSEKEKGKKKERGKLIY